MELFPSEHIANKYQHHIYKLLIKKFSEVFELLYFFSLCQEFFLVHWINDDIYFFSNHFFTINSIQIKFKNNKT